MNFQLKGKTLFNKHLITTVLFCLCFGAACTLWAQEQKLIEISITGLDDPLLQNVRSSLSLARQSGNLRLTENHVKKFYDAADREIAEALEPFGYYAPDITKTIRREAGAWTVEILVNKGEPVRITGIDIRLTGEGKDDEQLRRDVSGYRFPLQKGDILDHQLYELGKKTVFSTVAALGYRDASFSRNVITVNRPQLSARIQLILETGPRYLFGTTGFKADFLNTGLLERMLTYREGETFSARKLMQSRRALLNSEYFSRVDVTTGDPAPGSLNVPVNISLQPNKANKYGLGIGYGTDTGFRGSLEWTNRLLNRYGHKLDVLIQPSERKSNVGASYAIPIRDPRKDRLSLAGQWQKEYFDTTDTESRHASTAYDHIGEQGEYSVYLRYLDEDFEVGEDAGHATFLHPGINTVWRWADDRLLTKNGLRLNLNLTCGAEEIMSDTTFFQASTNAKAIVSFLDSWRVLGRFQLGWTEVGRVLDLSPSLRFYAGGDQSVRGYAYKTIGPEDSAGNVTGANHLLTYSLEIERTLFGNWSAALFFDSGDAMNALSDITMHNGAGGGLRWNAPFGQVRLDIAQAIGQENSWRIHFAAGADL